MFNAPNFSQAKLIVDNENYSIVDLELQDSNKNTLCTVSETILKPGMSTRGHSHKDKGEAYFFSSGEGWMALGTIDNTYDVGPESVIYVDKGIRHRVFNRSRTITLTFRTVFFGPSERPSFKKL